MRVHTNRSLFPALRELIPNIPEQGVVSLDLKMRPGEVLPTLTLTLECSARDGTPIVHEGEIITEVKRFKIVPIDTGEGAACREPL